MNILTLHNMNINIPEEFTKYIQSDDELQLLHIKKISWYRNIENNQKKNGIDPTEDDIIELYTIISDIKERYNLLTEIYMLGKIEKD